jgi:hypothetical protein
MYYCALIKNVKQHYENTKTVYEAT